MQGPAKGAMILLVEDNRAVGEGIAHALDDMGLHVLGPAATVGEALALLAVECPDAALLDMRLGGNESFSIADALIEGGVPFSFLTASSRCEFPFGYRQCRMLGKPFSESALEAEVLTLLRPSLVSIGT